MKAYEFIEKNIGNKVYVKGDGGLVTCKYLRRLILYKTELTVVKLTKSGMAYLVDENNNYYRVPPRYVRAVGC